jgi:HEPN domain-containing protein
MNPKIKNLANEWFQYAEQDLHAANKLLGEINHITCFHSQQAAEKYIKGLLVLRQIDFRKSHDLGYLLGLLNIEIPEKIFLASENLTEYAVEARYPGDFSSISDSEAEKAIAYANLIKNYILNLVQTHEVQ